MEHSETHNGKVDVPNKSLREEKVNNFKVNLDGLFVEMTYNLRKELNDIGENLSNSVIPEVVPELEKSKHIIMQCIETEKERLRDCLKDKCGDKNVKYQEESNEMAMQYDWDDWPNGLVTCMRCQFEWDGYAQHYCEL